MAWRLATCPTRRWPSSVNATTDGVVRWPSALGITSAWPPSIVAATTELVVPRSMPTAFAITAPFPFRTRSRSVVGRAAALASGRARRQPRGRWNATSLLGRGRGSGLARARRQPRGQVRTPIHVVRSTMATSVGSCVNCGRRNRVRSQREGIPRCSVCHHALPWIVDAGPADFDEELQASVPVLVDFWAAWCGPCRMVTPVVEELARTAAGRIKVVKLDVDGAPEIGARYQAQSIPLLVLHREGREVDRRVGALPPQALRQWLDPQLAPPPPVTAAG